MAKTLTKKELRAPDSFQSLAGQGARWIEENIKAIVALAAVIVALCFAWIGYGYYVSLQETQAENALFPIQAEALKKIQETKDPNSIQLTEFIDSLKSNSNTKAAASSAIQVIGALASIENTESLQKEILTAARFTPSEGNLLFGLWHLTEGQVLTRNGELAAARDSYQKVLGSSSHKELHPSALIQLGALAEREGDLSGARDFYKRVTVEFPDSEASGIADKLLIHLDLLGEGSSQGS